MDFYTRISKYYNDIFPINQAQISFVLSSSSESGKMKLLDVGCGTGGLSIAISPHFDLISAIDTNDDMLEIARNTSSAKNIDFQNCGMLDIDKDFNDSSFDTVLCFGNTIVHLQSLKEIELFFRKVKQLLKPSGKFLFQLINYDNVLSNSLAGLPTIENDRIKFERSYSLNENGLMDFTTILTVKKTNDMLESNVKLFPVRKLQIETALIETGFETIKTYSSFKKDPYNPQSLPLVFECSK
ncbi:MAG: class I SAM-dependent methyltransferase [Bacteroidetes bacterium]|nr:class I SAM-dependent methyltransferase [Bacteroidota bacterium]